MGASIASYFTEAFGSVRPIYAAICIASNNGHSQGDVLTWSVSKRATRDKIAAQWEPTAFRIVRIAVADR